MIAVKLILCLQLSLRCFVSSSNSESYGPFELATTIQLSLCCYMFMVAAVTRDQGRTLISANKSVNKPSSFNIGRQRTEAKRCLV